MLSTAITPMTASPARIGTPSHDWEIGPNAITPMACSSS